MAGEAEKMSCGQVLSFTSKHKYTMGVEVEFQILDRMSWDLVPFAPKLLAEAPSLLRPRLSPEFIQSILEIQTGICFSLLDVENDLMQTISLADELAESNNCRLFSASLHPFACYREQILTTNKRYARILDELQIVGRRFISQGFHVHVGVADGDSAIRVCNRIQAYLPLLLALSASSPYSQGEDTGLMSYRTKLFEALPLAGRYGYFEDWKSFAEEVAKLVRVGVIESIRDLWWDCRPNAEYGTVEIRVCDLPIRFKDILALTSLIQCLVATLAEEDGSDAPLDPYMVQANKWQAARHGLSGAFADPRGKLNRSRGPTVEAVKRLLDMVEPMSVRLGSESYLQGVETILSRGVGSDFLRSSLENTGSMASVIQELHGEFWK